MATSNPTLKAIHGALSELRRAPLLEKARAAETVATLTLTLLTEFERRLVALELAAPHCDCKSGRECNRRAGCGLEG